LSFLSCYGRDSILLPGAGKCMPFGLIRRKSTVTVVLSGELKVLFVRCDGLRLARRRASFDLPEAA
jgi:hypothetical protein